MREVSKFTFIMCILIFTACNKELDEISTIIPDEIVTRSSIVQNPIDQLLGMPVNIILSYSSRNRYLSCNFHLFPSSIYVGVTPNNGNYSQWILEKEYNKQGYDYYLIRALINPDPSRDRIYFDATSDKTWHASWLIAKKNIGGDNVFAFIPKDNEKNKYYIKTEFAINREQTSYPPKTPFVFAHTLPDKNEYGVAGVDMFETVTNEMFLTWEIQPAEQFELENIEYQLTPNDLVEQMPDFLSTTIVKNQTSLEQSMAVSFTDKATEQSRFSETEGLTVQISAGLNVGIPVFNGSGSISHISSSSWTFESSQSKEDSRTYTFNVRVAPYTTVRAVASVAMYKATVTYVATLKGRTTGKRLTLTGTWAGVSASTVTYSLVEEASGKVLKTFTEIPSGEIDLTQID